MRLVTGFTPTSSLADAVIKVNVFFLPTAAIMSASNQRHSRLLSARQRLRPHSSQLQTDNRPPVDPVASG